MSIKPGNNSAEPAVDYRNITAKSDSPLVTIVNDETPVPIVVDTATKMTPDTSQVKPADPVEQASDITDDEVSNITNLLDNFYTADNNEDIDAILGYFQFPISRYYNSYNVDYQTLQGMFDKSFHTLLVSHKLTVDWNRTTITKAESGYTISLVGTYDKVLTKEPDVEKRMELDIIIKLNSDKKITSIYNAH